jgi:hypothetical protein
MPGSTRPTQFGRIYPADEAWLARQPPEPCPSSTPITIRGSARITATCWNAFKRIAAGASPAEKLALFSGTARRAYRLD